MNFTFFKWTAFWDPTILSDRFFWPTLPPKSFRRKDWETRMENWTTPYPLNVGIQNVPIWSYVSLSCIHMYAFCWGGKVLPKIPRALIFCQYLKKSIPLFNPHSWKTKGRSCQVRCFLPLHVKCSSVKNCTSLLLTWTQRYWHFW